MMQPGDCVPVPPLYLWGGVAAYTLVASASKVRAVKPVREGELAYDCLDTALTPEDVAKSIKDLVSNDPYLEGGKAPLTRESGLVLTRHDLKEGGYLDRVLSKLCLSKPARDVTIAELAGAVEEALRGECRAAFEPAETLSFLRAEYYKYVRSFPPQPANRFEARRHIMMPAVAQAMGLLGHVYTSVYANKRDNISRHLVTPVPPGSGESAFEKAGLLLAGVRNVLRKAWPQWAARLGGIPWTVQALLAGAVAYEVGGGDYLEEAVLSGGNTVSVHESYHVPGLPVAETIRLSLAAEYALSLDERLSGVDPKVPLPEHAEGRVLESGLSKAVAAAVTRVLPRERGGQRDPDLENKRALVEYSGFMVQYAFTVVSGRPQPMLAYAAARTARMYYESLRLAGYNPWWLEVLSELAARAAVAEQVILGYEA